MLLVEKQTNPNRVKPPRKKSKLDLILERLDKIETRLDKIEDILVRNNLK